MSENKEKKKNNSLQPSHRGETHILPPIRRVPRPLHVPPSSFLFSKEKTDRVCFYLARNSEGWGTKAKLPLPPLYFAIVTALVLQPACLGLSLSPLIFFFRHHLIFLLAMPFFAAVFTVVLATLFISSGAVVIPGYRANSCSFGYNNVYYIIGGKVCAATRSLGQMGPSLPPHPFL